MAAAAAVGGSALLLGIALAVPATVLGRLGLPLVALGRDMPWVAPGNVLQAAAQELEFRGLLMGALERVAPPWMANLGQATKDRRAVRAGDYRARLAARRFHDTRHTAATMLLQSGVHPKVASEMLGHSSVTITLDRYSHVVPTMQQEAARLMDALLSQ